MKIRGLYDNNLHPPRFGGAERIFRIYRGLARRAEVRVLSLLRTRERAPRSETVDGIQVERRKPLYPTALAYTERLRLVPLFAAFHLHRRLGGRFAGHFREERAVYQFDSFLLTALYDRVPAGALKVYHAVNVETEWYQPVLRRLFARRHWEGVLRRIEQHAVRGADLVAHVSARDGERLVSEFGARRERLLLVPNGLEPDRFRPRDPGERAAVRARLGLRPDHRVAVFVGSPMVHNLEAARFILERLAPACASRTHVRFLLVGDLVRGPLPPNARATGAVPDVLPYLAAADVALNPVVSGSGTSLKLPEYLAAGLPVVTTAFGMRGFEDLADCLTLAELPEMERALAQVKPLPEGLAPRLAAYAWDAQADKLFRAYQAWFEDPGEAPARWACIA
ncbi:MAG TPA: glycosyltransferase [Candidatus Saccharimonadales bacterium]|nr:glycosyltransferase [Candidatus Saccharimonadales bacterium]